MNLKLSQQAALLIAVPLMFQLVFVVSLSYLLNAAETEAQRQARAKNLVAQMNELTKMCQDAAQSLYFYTQSKGEDADQPLQELMRQIPLKMAIVKGLAREDFEDSLPVRQLEKTVGEALWVMSRTHRQKKYKTGSDQPEVMWAVRGVRGIRALLTRAHSTIDMVSKTRTDMQESRRLSLYIQYILVGGLSFNILLAIFLAYFFYQGTNKRLSILMENSFRLAEEQALIPALGGNDEIGRLDNVFHKMASSLREAQRKERAVVRYAVDVICSLDEERRFTAINPAAFEVLGFTPAELVGTDAAQLVVGGERDEFIDSFADSIRDKSVQSFECRVQKKDGTFADILWSSHWSFEERSAFCVMHDISDRKEVERLKQEFVAMISHDLRTPLMSVQTDLCLLSAGASGDLPGSAIKRVTDCERNIEYLISLINNLLDVEKMEAGSLELDLSSLSLDTIAQRAVDAVKALALNKDLTIETQLEPIEIQADADRLTQVTINLLSNAIKYSPAGGTVTIAVGDLGDHVRLSVSDQGPGIPPDERDKIFNRFHQVSAADARVHKGTGLGLAICKLLVEQHGGVIGVDSKVGKGCLFWCRLPKG